MKKILVISLVLALALALILPSAAMAAAPSASKVPAPSVFKAIGSINGIDTGTVKELGHSGKWLVTDRHIRGNFSGSLNGAFTLTYDGVFALATQEGNLHGILKMDNGKEVCEINGKVDPYVVVPADAPYYYLPRLNIHGHWTFLKGGIGTGDFSAWVEFVPDADGHILAIPFSSFEMDGKYIKAK